MKDEIKEILEFKEDADYKRLSVDAIVTLEDYITNLQEENKMYAQLKEEYEDIIDKAMEYIKKEIADIDFMKKEYKDIDRIYDTIVEIDVRCVNKLNNILNGDNE